MKTIQWKKSAFKTLSVFAFLGGAFYTLTPSPAFAQTAPPATAVQDGPPAPPVDADGPQEDAPPAPPADGPRERKGARGNDLTPIEGAVKVDPSGRLVGPGSERGRGPRDERGPRDAQDGPRGPRDRKGPRGERDARGPEDGPRGPRDRKGPREGGPGDEERGPGADGPRGPKGGPRDRGPEGGPRDPKDGPRGPKGGPRDRGPEGGPRDERGPRGPQDGPGHKGGPHNDKGPRDGRGPQGGPREGGPDADKGPRNGRPPAPPADGPDDNAPPAPPADGLGDGGPRAEGPDGAMQRAYRSAAEIDRYGQLQGDVLNLTGQARSYYIRATAAQKVGNAQQATILARVSERLTQAALHLERAQHGSLPVAQVAGWSRPATGAAKVPANGEQARVLSDLTQRLQEQKTTGVSAENSTWQQTAGRLATQARSDFASQRIDAGRERAHAALTLLDAVQLQAQIAQS